MKKIKYIFLLALIFLLAGCQNQGELKKENLPPENRPVTERSDNPTTKPSEAPRVVVEENAPTVMPVVEKQEPIAEEAPKKEEIMVKVSFPDKTESGTVPYQENMTVQDVIKKFLEAKNIDYELTGFGNFVYMREIGGYRERDYGPMSGWLYNVNGESPTVGCGEYVLHSGDFVEWCYEKGQ